MALPARAVTIKDVAEHLLLGWDTVKEIQAKHLQRRFGKPKLGKSWLALGLCVAVASGGVAFFIDGPWCPGGSNVLQPAFLPKMGGGPILTAEAGTTVMTYRGLPDPTFFVAGTSQDPENATKIIESFTTEVT